MTTPVLRLAVCLFPDVTTLDYQGPVELFSFFSPKNLERFPFFKAAPPFAIETTYIAYNLDPVQPTGGPPVVPSRTYSDVGSGEQFDILLIPGGPGAHPNSVEAPLIKFIQRQAPGAKYILSVCTGSWILANAGLLKGKYATTNKFSFNTIKEATKDCQVNWVAKARWVVDNDKKIWTSSGVTAGTDMAKAFLDHLMGNKYTEIVRGIVELRTQEEGDDEFASHFGLV